MLLLVLVLKSSTVMHSLPRIGFRSIVYVAQLEKTQNIIFLIR